jgi:hypothetical protein
VKYFFGAMFARTYKEQFIVGLKKMLSHPRFDFKRTQRNFAPSIIDAAIEHAWRQQEDKFVSGDLQGAWGAGIVNVAEFLAETVRVKEDLGINS